MNGFMERKRENLPAVVAEQTLRSIQQWSGRSTAHLSELNEKMKRYVSVKHSMESLGEVIIALERRIQFQAQQVNIGESFLARNNQLEGSAMLHADQEALERTLAGETEQAKTSRVSDIMQRMNQWSTRATASTRELAAYIQEYVVIKNRKLALEKDIEQLQDALRDTTSMLDVKRRAMDLQVVDLAKHMMHDQERVYHEAQREESNRRGEEASPTEVYLQESREHPGEGVHAPLRSSLPFLPDFGAEEASSTAAGLATNDPPTAGRVKQLTREYEEKLKQMSFQEIDRANRVADRLSVSNMVPVEGRGESDDDQSDDEEEVCARSALMEDSD